MFPWLLFAVIILSVQSASPRPTLESLRTRLVAEEKRASGSPDPRPFGAIARAIFDLAAASPRFPVWSEACLSSFAVEPQRCNARFWAELSNAATPLRQRAASGAALVGAKDSRAATALHDLVRRLNTQQLTAVAPFLRALPEAKAVPLLIHLLESTAPGAQVAACRVLGYIDAQGVRAALQIAVTKAPPSSEVWNACMVARARLGEPDSVRTISGYTHYMSGEPLVDAAQAMLEGRNEQGLDVLKKASREASPSVQLDAARLLVDVDRAEARRIASPRLNDVNPALRAKAVVVLRHLAGTPDRVVRAMLLDADELVRLRAAETVLEWAGGGRSGASGAGGTKFDLQAAFDRSLHMR